MVSFTTESSIHGVIHIFGPNRNIFVRIFWILLFILSIFGFVYYVREAYIKWLIDPDIVTKSRNRYAEEFPEMALTVCPTTLAEIESLKLRNYNISSDFEVTEEECKNLRMDATWCAAYQTLVRFKVKNCHIISNMLLLNSALSLSEAYFNLNALNFSRGGIKNGEFFDDSQKNIKSTNVHKILTKFGICATFNMYTKSIFKEELMDNNYGLIKPEDPQIEWSADSKFFTPNPENPKRFNEGRIDRFNFVFLDESRFCNKEQKLTVIAHQPNEFPTPDHPSIEVNADSLSTVFISIESFRSNENLRVLDPKTRNCYYENEQELKIFQNYTQKHCELECLNDFMIEMMDCHLLYLPTEKNSTKKFCLIFGEDQTNDIKMDKSIQQCQCLPSCNYLEYKLSKGDHLYGPGRNFTTRRGISFWRTVTLIVVETERFATYTLPNFVAETGGFLGLFMGCSLLSIVEIFFFITSKLANIAKKLIRNQPEESSRNIDQRDEELNSIDQRVKIIEEKVGIYSNSDDLSIRDLIFKLETIENSLRDVKKKISNIEQEIQNDLKIENLE